MTKNRDAQDRCLQNPRRRKTSPIFSIRAFWPLSLRMKKNFITFLSTFLPANYPSPFSESDQMVHDLKRDLKPGTKGEGLSWFQTSFKSTRVLAMACVVKIKQQYLPAPGRELHPI